MLSQQVLAKIQDFVNSKFLPDKCTPEVEEALRGMFELPEVPLDELFGSMPKLKETAALVFKQAKTGSDWQKAIIAAAICGQVGRLVIEDVRKAEKERELWKTPMWQGNCLN